MGIFSNLSKLEADRKEKNQAEKTEKKADCAEQEVHSAENCTCEKPQSEKTGKDKPALEKGDALALLLAAFKTFLPVILIFLGIFVLLALVMFIW